MRTRGRQYETDTVQADPRFEAAAPIGYPAGQSYGDHAFRSSGELAPHVCWYCGLGASDPFHANHRPDVTPQPA